MRSGSVDSISELIEHDTIRRITKSSSQICKLSCKTFLDRAFAEIVSSSTRRPAGNTSRAKGFMNGTVESERHMLLRARGDVLVIMSTAVFEPFIIDLHVHLIGR